MGTRSGEGIFLHEDALTSSSILQFPDFSLPFYVQSDAIDKGFYAVLGHHEGTEVVVTYASKTIGSSQLNWSTIDKEAFAIVWSMKHFGNYFVWSHRAI